eukprot:TRINITY_DN5078_c1_g1_i1.p1 TRINITY_DN5078_c1_g1~~TRINITY_DN5078_c1_g1_i1.p1  ORF type:complete len:107 (-),score=17.54 TRINITY_DN5078_c1_g1_i1:114-434(-)
MFQTQVRLLSRIHCVGRTARDIIETDKLEKVLRRRNKHPDALARNRGSRPPAEATYQQSLLQVFPKELLDHRFEDLEVESRLAGRKGARAKEALRWLLSPLFDRPR